jgi:thiamine biosynthesis lipoprotein ApbE
MSDPSDIKVLAQEIADDLFMNGQGQEATRLVLTVDRPLKLDLGGLSKPVVVDRIARALKRARQAAADVP